MKKIIKPINKIVLISILLIVLLPVGIYIITLNQGYTPIFIERKNLKSDEMELLISNYNIQLSDGESIFAARLAHAKDSCLMVWINGIEDEEDFVTKNLNDFSYSGAKTFENIDGNTIEVQYYSLGFDEWYLYKDNDSLVAVMVTDKVPASIGNLFV